MCNAMLRRNRAAPAAVEEKTTGRGSDGGGWEKSLKINIMQPARFVTRKSGCDLHGRGREDTY